VAPATPLRVTKTLVNFRQIWERVHRSSRRVAALLVLVLGISSAIAAAPPLSVSERAQLQIQQQTLLQQILKSPANVDVILGYAKVSAQLGDNEGAISALERLLLFKPNMPQVELELGALYFRLGSFEFARSYLQKANADNPPPEAKARIDRYLAEIPRLERAQKITSENQINPIVPASATKDRIPTACDNNTRLNVIFLYGAELTVTGLNGVSQTTKTPGFAIAIPCAGASPSTPFPVPPGGTTPLLRALNGESGRNGGAEVTLTAANLSQSGISDIISGDFTTSVSQAVNQSTSTATQTILNINNANNNNNNNNPNVNNTTNNNQNCNTVTNSNINGNNQNCR